MFTLNYILKPTLLILIAIFMLYIYNHLVKDLKLCCDNTDLYSYLIFVCCLSDSMSTPGTRFFIEIYMTLEIVVRLSNILSMNDMLLKDKFTYTLA